MAALNDASIFAGLVQDFFTRRLITERNASPRTVEAYRDALRLLLRYVATTTKKPATAVTLADLDAPLVLRFLQHLEEVRGNSARSRNLRLAAIRSFLRYASLRTPEALPSIQRVMAIPQKKFDRPVLGSLTQEEVQAILDAADVGTWHGDRDHVMFSVMYNSGARVSEVVGLRVEDVEVVGRSGAIRIRGKGRRERTVPLWKETTRRVRSWMIRLKPEPGTPLFPNRWGDVMTRSGFESRLRRAVSRAAKAQVSLRRSGISPHTFRHTTAMHLLQSGVHLDVIALWLGHANPATTHQYLEANMEMKRRTLDRLESPRGRRPHRRPPERLLEFLDSL